MKYTKHGEMIPETFEEYEQIHGKIDYVNDVIPYYPLKIKHEVCEVEEPVPEYNKDEFIIKNSLNYEKIARYMISYMNLISYKGIFFSVRGEVAAESIRKSISELLAVLDYQGKFDTATNSILNTMRDFSNTDNFEPDKNTIYFNNGELVLNGDGNAWTFYENRLTHTPFRLSVKLDVSLVGENLPCVMFSHWLHDVFYEDDIPTVQQLLGSCLLPENKVQEAFILVGSAGVGKSVLGYLLHKMFGGGFCAINLTELDENRFVLANVENKLIIYDDDLQTRALTDTGVFKKLITSEQPIKAERKGQQPYMFTPYGTVIANCNQMLQSLYDDSEGFFRRLHPLEVRKRAAGRRDIYNMNEKVASEKDLIIIWMLQGLWTLRHRKYKIWWSDRSKEFIDMQKNPFKAFFDTCFEITGKYEEDQVTTEKILQVYNQWCRRNAVIRLSDRRLVMWLGANYDILGIRRRLISRKRLGGYGGLKIAQPWEV